MFPNPFSDASPILDGTRLDSFDCEEAVNPLTTTVPPARLARERTRRSSLLQILEITRTAISYTLRGHMSSSSLIKHTQVHQGPPFPHMDIPGCRDVQIS